MKEELHYGFDELALIEENHDVAGKILFDLKRDLMYRDKKGTVHVVRKEKEPSDLGTIPRIAWFLVPPHEYPSCYILHDDKCNDKTFPRLAGDLLLKESLRFCKAPLWKVWIVFGAVRYYAITRGIK